MTTYLQEELKVTLPENFTVRGAKLEDVEPALALYNHWAQVLIQEDEITDADAIRSEWVSPGFDPMEDIRLVFAPNGEMVGYIEVWTNAKPPVHPWIWGRVHPDYADLGIGTWMLQWAEERAKQALSNIPDDLRFAPRVGIYQQADASKKLFEDMGFQRIRSSYRMRINMDAPPTAPLWPDGITIRTFNPEADIEAVYSTVDEAFSDHFGHVEEPFEEGLERFKHSSMGYAGFDPTLWFLAMDGDEIAGISLCRNNAYDNPDVGWVNTLGVLRPWRKRGIGLALLHHSFGELYRRGKRMIGLGVDAENLTGALRLYKSAGMHVHLAFDLFEKELRPGREISVQSL